MADSPRCLSCIEKGKVGQTYKLAGRPEFKCSDCKTVYAKSKFDEMAFLWKENQLPMGRVA